MFFEAGDKQSLTSKVYDHIRNGILDGSYKDGDYLVETRLAEKLQVSRTPVREALRRLENEGLVQIIPGWGACLASPTRQEIIDTYEVREELEIMAIRKAAKHITPLQLCRLQEQIDAEHETFVNRNLESYLTVNDNFHIIIAESSGNNTLVGYIKNILSRTFVQMIFFESFFDFDTNPSLEEHIIILEALKNHDEAESVRLIREHLRLSREGLKTK